MSVSGNKARSRCGECLHLKGNKRGGEIRTCLGAPVPLTLEPQQLCYLTWEISRGWREEEEGGEKMGEAAEVGEGNKVTKEGKSVW